MDVPPLRDRSTLPVANRRLELIAPEELARALERVVTDSYGIELAAIPPAACRLLGFQRTTEEMRAQIAPVLDGLVREGRLSRQGEHVVRTGS